MIQFMSLVSGSSGNSSLISDGKTTLLIDCGISGIKLTERLSEAGFSPSDISGLLITHEHSDHTCGVGVVARRFGIPLYATEKTFAAMKPGKVNHELLNNICAGKTFSIGNIEIHPFSIPHDAADPVGYSFYTDSGKYTLATDMGFMPDTLFNELKGSRQIILESNHDIEMLRFGAYPYYLKQRILSESGHMSNELSAKVSVRLADCGTESIMLAHLSRENNTPEIAELTTHNALCSEGFSNVNLSVASRYNVTRFAV